MDNFWKVREASMMVLVKRLASAAREAANCLVILVGWSDICAPKMNEAIQDFIQFVEGDIIFTCQQLNDLAAFQHFDQDHFPRIFTLSSTIQLTISGSTRQSDNPEINRMLGTEGSLGEMLGLSKDWGVNVIKTGGNYGEIFARYLGTNTKLGLQRGVNALYTNGGLIYAPPMR